jgi:hypothetical protein
MTASTRPSTPLQMPPLPKARPEERSPARKMASVRSRRSTATSRPRRASSAPATRNARPPSALAATRPRIAAWRARRRATARRASRATRRRSAAFDSAAERPPVLLRPATAIPRGVFAPNVRATSTALAHGKSACAIWRSSRASSVQRTPTVARRRVGATGRMARASNACRPPIARRARRCAIRRRARVWRDSGDTTTASSLLDDRRRLVCLIHAPPRHPLDRHDDLAPSRAGASP